MTDYTGFTNSEYVEALEAERSELQAEVARLKKSAEADCTLIANQVCHIHDLETSLKEVQDNLTKAEKAEHGTCEECGDKGVVLHDTTWGNICQACEWGH